MHVIKETGLLATAELILSPNYHARPEGGAIDIIVIHGISLPTGQFGNDGVIHLFTNQLLETTESAFAHVHGLKVSSHVFIRRDGHIIQFVPFHACAWHAGVSRFQGRDNCNDFSIGIELEGTDTLAYEEIQYTQLQQVIDALQQMYPTIKHIVGHSDIAPGRKTDPGPMFRWEKLKNR